MYAPPLPTPPSPAPSPPVAVAAWPAAWYPDPWAPASGWLRWWDGQAWTTLRTDQLTARWGPSYGRPWQPEPPGPQSRPRWPLPAAAIALGVGALLLGLATGQGASWAARHLHGVPVVLRIAAIYTILWGPMVAGCVLAVRRWGRGRLRDRLELRVRPTDLGWGVLAFAGAIVAEAVVRVLITVVAPSAVGHNQGPPGGGVAAVAFAVVAIVCAPIIEELVFRGIIMRALQARMQWGWAVVIQGLLFGAYHSQARYGVSNIGLTLMLGSVGVVFGLFVHWTGRLGPSMVAHAINNTVATIAGLLLWGGAARLWI